MTSNAGTCKFIKETFLIKWSKYLGKFLFMMKNREFLVPFTLQCCVAVSPSALQFQDARWGGGPTYEYPEKGLLAFGASRGARGTAGVLVGHAALAASLQPPIPPPSRCHHLRLQVMCPGANPRQTGRYHVSKHACFLFCRLTSCELKLSKTVLTQLKCCELIR
jgi:hypothetical protein